MNLEQLIENNWDDLKDEIRGNWNKLTSQDLKQIEGSYDILIGKLKKTYGRTRKEIEMDLKEFFSSNSFDGLKETMDDISTTHGMKSFKNTVEKYTKDYMKGIQEKSTEFEKCVVSYAMENPLKILGTAAILCFAFNRIFEKQKS